MPRVSVFDVGSIGIIQDTPSHLLPPEAWSDGQNVRFQDNKVKKFTGHSLVFDPPTVAPYWAIAIPDSSEVFWLYTGLAEVYTVQQNGTHTKITRASGTYTGNATDKWNGGVLGGLAIITNGVDDPQLWSPVAAGTALVDLTNWPASTECKIIRAFKNFLVAFNITDGGTKKPHMVKWSHTADPGSVPSSWDETDATKDTGEIELSDSQAGIIQDAMTLRDLMIIYKDNATWGMQHIGGRFIFRFFPIFTGTGILSQRCVAALPNGEQHFVATGDDLIIHNGQRAESIIDKTWKRFINDNLDPDNLTESFCVSNPRQNEMWFCFPEVDATLPSLAIVWNTKDGTIGVRDLDPEARFIALGVIDEGSSGETWDGDSDSWDSDNSLWGGREFAPQTLELFQVDSANTKLFKLDTTNQFNTTNITSFIERDGLALIGTDRNNRPKVDVTRRKLVKRIWPRMDGGAISIQIGSQEEVGGAVTYADAQTFNPGVDQYLDFTVSGRLIAVKFQSTGNVTWSIHGYDLDIDILGAL